MIPLAELVGWSAHAAWASPAMVEQDYLLCLAMEQIFTDAFLSEHVTMRGGTVLHKGHLAPAARYSEDIDLVVTNLRPGSHVGKALKRVLSPLLGPPKVDVIGSAWLTLRNAVQPSKILRQTYAYPATGYSSTTMAIKIEVNLNENVPLFPLTSVPVVIPDRHGGILSLSVPSYALDEMLATKVRALLQREQGRDLYDLHSAWLRAQQSNGALVVDPVQVGIAFRHYLKQEGTHLSQPDIEARLAARLAKPAFRQDMRSFLPQGQPPFDPDQAAATFRTHFLPHL